HASPAQAGLPELDHQQRPQEPGGLLAEHSLGQVDQQHATGVEDVLEVDRRLRLTEDVAHSRPQQDRAQPSQYGADPAELFSLTESPKRPPKVLEPDRIVNTSRPAGL